MGGLFKGGSGGGSMKAAVDEWKKLQTPDIQSMQIQLEQMIQQGQITPEEAEAVLMGESQMSGITLDPKLKETQMSALSSLMDISDSGGMTAMDQANLAKIQNQEMAAQRGQRDAILQNANARGVGGSGLELMAQLQNQQDSATRQSQRDLDIAGMAQERALKALMQGGEMAGQMSAQDFSQQAQKAQAQDAIAQFNAQNQNQFNMANVNARNQAQARNLSEKQRVADANVGSRNQAQQYNKGLIQQDFNNRATKAGGLSGALSGQAQMQAQKRQSDLGLVGGLIGAGVGAFGGPATAAVGQQVGSQVMAGDPNQFAQFAAEDGGLVGGEPTEGDSQHHFLKPGELIVKKEDVPDYLAKAHTDENGKFDAAGFLDQLTGYKYNYSGKKTKGA